MVKPHKVVKGQWQILHLSKGKTKYQILIILDSSELAQTTTFAQIIKSWNWMETYKSTEYLIGVFPNQFILTTFDPVQENSKRLCSFQVNIKVLNTQKCHKLWSNITIA